MFKIFITPPVTNSQILSVHILNRQTNTIVRYVNPLPFRVDTNFNFFSIGIPSVSYGLGQNGGDIAVEVDPEMIKYVQVYRHFVCIAHSSTP
uniref:hypothetical protein n=1 Tax=Pseudomonas sp. SST3 TaxID=2267882 RepID=UPI001F50F811|nr:hypothetical protein [Pseudomonas sp. SST3]